MAKNTHIIEVKTVGATKAKKQVDGVGSSLKGMAAKATAAVATAYAFGKAIQVATDLAKQAAKVKDLENGFDALGKKLGFTSGSLDKLRGAVNGTVNDMDLMEQANNAMLLGVVDSDEQMAQLFDTAQRLGQALGVDATDAVNSLVTGMGRQSKLMLDNLGIMIDTNGAYERYAEKLGIATEALDDNQKKQAFNEEVLRAASSMVDELGAEAETSAMRFAQMQTSIFNAGTALGELFAPAVDLGVIAITGLADAISSAINWQEELRRSMEEDVVVYTQSAQAFDDWKESMQGATKAQIIGELVDLGIVMEDINKATLNGKDMMQEYTTAMENSLKPSDDFKIIWGETTDDLNANNEQLLYLIELLTLLEESQTASNTTSNEMLTTLEEMNAKEQERIELKEYLSELTVEELENMGLFALAAQKEAEELENLTDAWDNFIKGLQENAKKQEQIDKQVLRDKKGHWGDLIGNLQIVGEEFEAFHKVYKAAAIAKTIYDTYEGAQAAYTGMVEAYKGQPFAHALGVAAALAATAAGLARVQQIRRAATGADYITDGPEIIMVGDNPSGRERVQVTPLGGDPNIDGPQGGGITLNISGNVLTDDFVEDVLVDKLQEALRMGDTLN
tara:strand:+ start:6308 stop:8170 length:1863 start_codon:yes stop_codon:yes gene_type:complete